MDRTSVEIIHGRQNPMIDTPVGLHIWGWEVPVYLFLGGIVAGVMILLVALELKTGRRPRSVAAQLAPFGAAALMGAGMGALLLDLEYPAHVYRFFMAFKPTSPMSWGSWIITLVFPMLVALGLGGLGEPLRSRLGPSAIVQGLLGLADRHRAVILWGSLAFGVAVGVYTGLLLGTMAARLTWNTAVLGPLFLTSGVSTGAAALLLLPLEPEERHLLVRWDMAAMAVELVLLAVMLVAFATGGAAAQAAVAPLLGGVWTAWFWSLVVLGGLVAPLILDGLEVARGLPMVRIVPVLVLVGGYALRAILVAAGQQSSLAALHLTP